MTSTFVPLCFWSNLSTTVLQFKALQYYSLKRVWPNMVTKALWRVYSWPPEKKKITFPLHLCSSATKQQWMALCCGDSYLNRCRSVSGAFNYRWPRCHFSLSPALLLSCLEAKQSHFCMWVSAWPCTMQLHLQREQTFQAGYLYEGMIWMSGRFTQITYAIFVSSRVGMLRYLGHIIYVWLFCINITNFCVSKCLLSFKNEQVDFE